MRPSDPLTCGICLKTGLEGPWIVPSLPEELTQPCTHLCWQPHQSCLIVHLLLTALRRSSTFFWVYYISLSSILLNLWESAPSVVGEVCSGSSHLPECRRIDSIQLPGCFLTRLKALLSYENRVSVFCNKMVLPRPQLCAGQPFGYLWRRAGKPLSLQNSLQHQGSGWG